MPTVRTIAAVARIEIDKIKGSRFIATATPAPSEAAAGHAIESVRGEIPTATHHCFAWRLGDDRTRASDDGEPTGSAGAPILRRIEGAGLEEVVLVVTRFYGGTKLGTGGLVRAYGAAAAAVLETADIVERRLMRTVRVVHAYDLSGVIEGVLRAHGVTATDATYGTDVRLQVPVPVEDVDGFIAELREVTAGRVEAG